MGTTNYKDSYDVIIIGSGPAGSAAAFFLAKSGIKTMVIEKEKLPRYKTCGGGVVGRVKDLLPFDFTEIIETNCLQAEVYDSGSKSHFMSKRSAPIIMTAMRQNLDSFILAKAVEQGTMLLDKCEVTGFKINGNGVEIHAGTEIFFANFIIAADGASGIVSKILKANDYLVKLPALEYEVYTDPDTFSRFSNKARFDFGIPCNGYGWVFPKKDHLSIGVVAMTKSRVNLNETYCEYLKSLGIETIIKSERHGYIIPVVKRKTVLNHRRILFAGDSAGFADPLTAEGISSAVLSGRCAAEAIIGANFDESKAAYLYNKAISRSILKEHKYARIVSVLVYNFPKVRSFLFRHYGQKMSEVITDIFSGKRKYSTLLRSPGFYLKLIKYFLNNKKYILGSKRDSSIPVNNIP